MQLETWLIYLVTCIGLSLSPGPNGLLALTHGALHGTRKTSFTILGGVLGFVVLIGLCMFGIGALIKSSIHWLTALKWLGGLYLIWLGIQVWRSPAITIEFDRTRATAKGRTMFRQGFLSAVTNPKGLLFFSAFLPQFIDPQRSLFIQFLVVAATFAGTEIVTEYVLAGAPNASAPGWPAPGGASTRRAAAYS